MISEVVTTVILVIARSMSLLIHIISLICHFTLLTPKKVMLIYKSRLKSELSFIFISCAINKF